jgi:hypothetical protein
MSNNNEADSTCRNFRVTILQDELGDKVNGTSQESDSDGALEESTKTTRRFEDIGGEEPDLDSTEIRYNQKVGMIKGPLQRRSKYELSRILDEFLGYLYVILCIWWFPFTI